MKLPKNFGGQGFGNMMQQMQSAMEQARQLEDELAAHRIAVDKGPVKAVFDGTGMLVGLKIDKSVVDPEDIESLEDLIVGLVRDGFGKATELRNSKVQGILPKVPGLPDM